MIDSYVEQCKQAGRELAVKEASVPMSLLGVLGGSALAARAGIGNRTLNRAMGKTSGGLLGLGTGTAISLANNPTAWMRKADRLAARLPADPSGAEALSALGLMGAGTTAGILGGGALIRAAERARRAETGLLGRFR